MENINKLPELKPFAKIPRLSREIYVTEKIDGTNGCICIGENGEFFVGSRTRWLSPETGDNHGFLLWAMTNKAELIAGLGPGKHFGEWWGSGIQRGYGLKEKRFSLFNAIRWTPAGNELQRIPCGDPRIEKWTQHAPGCCSVVPVLFRGLFETKAVDDALWELQKGGSIASPGFNRPEGVVVFHMAANIFFKKTIEKDEEAKNAGKR